VERSNTVQIKFQWIIVLMMFLASLLLTSHANAQTKGFSRDRAVFIKELGEYLATVNNDKLNKEYENLLELWNASDFSEEQEDLIMRMCTRMQLDRLKVDPDFHELVRTIVASRDSSVSRDKFDNWSKVAYGLLKSNQELFKEFLPMSGDVFREHVFYRDDSKLWEFTGGDFRFILKKDQVLLEVKKADLICQGPDDKFTLRGTNGTFDLATKRWEGDKGRTDWERSKMSTTELFVEFGHYEIDATKGEFEHDSALVTYNGVLEEKVYGHYKDKISSAKISSEREDFSDSEFPQFESYRNKLKISAFGDEQVKYTGGLSLSGNKMKGTGSADERAEFQFYKEDKLTVRVVSSNFKITPEKITSNSAQVTILTDSGEIYHPTVKFSFLRDKREITITRGDKGLEQAPFYDTDHNLEIWVDQIKWKLEEPKIEFDMLLNDAKARFQSKNFYREFNYERLTRGMMSYHPITKMYQHCIRMRSDTFTLTDYAFAIGSKRENLLPQMFMLADEGFIYLDLETDKIKVKEKLFNYYRNHFKLADYDVIRFISVIGGRPNATLNLINYDLQLEGVRLFHFSDSQNVVVIPHEQQVTVKNNRRLTFGGRVTAGRFDFYGQDFDFRYEGFDINSNNIDSMKLFFPDTIDQSYLIPIKTVLRDLSGTLYIDKPHNKSGIKDFPEYPKFVSRSPAVISYDKKGIHNGAYKKDIFRFEVDPFEIDSMDNFTIAGLTFPGTFVSGGILPEFKYEARIMKDYSLGFTRKNPPGGYPMYGGKGHGEIDISMSEEGFQAKGEITYEGAVIESQDIIMMPDSTNAIAESCRIEKSEKYPRVEARDVLTHWMPKVDSMYVNTNGHEVDIFSDGQVFTGDLVQTPKQLAGGGDLAWDNAVLSSKAMVFGPEKADAAVSSIRIGDIDAGMISFASDNVKSHIDFEKRTGNFRANKLGQFAEFAYNQYATSMDDFKWDMDKKTILVTSSGRMPDEKSVFLSRRADQGGLSFQSTKALFDMNTGIIYAEEIPHIDIADSRVFPLDGKAVIEKDAVMRPLENAKMLASRDNKFHELIECTIRIMGKYNISGEGNYIYKDKHLTGQKIHFNQMRVLRDTTVMAKGFISDSLDFAISPRIQYKGHAELHSDQEHLRFDGYALPLHTFKDYTSIYFRYSGQPDPKNVIMDARSPKNEIKKGIDISMNIAPIDSINVYPSFFNFKRVYSDPEITTDTGIFYYDQESSTFFAGDSNRLLNNAPRGSYISFNEDTRMIQSEGKLDLGLDFRDEFFVKPSGKIYKHEDDSTFTFESMWAMHMRIPEECWLRLQEVIAKNGDKAPKYSPDREDVKHRLAEILDDKDYKQVVKGISDFGEVQVKKDIGADLLMTNVKFRYNKRLGAFAGYDAVELATVGDKAINQKFDSRIFIEQKRSGTRLVFYLEVSKYDWFYFEYQRGILYIYTTDKEFNDAIRIKGRSISKDRYLVRLASPVKVSRQIDKMDTLREID